MVATHLPSGTRYGAVSNVEGKYSIPGMRIGGPYRLSVSFIGFSTQDVDGLILSLGTFSNVNVTLKEDGQELSEVLITADQNSLFSSERTGANTAISNSMLNKLPTISRRINDFT